VPVPPSIAEFWGRYVAATGGVDESRFYEAFHFGDHLELANSLAELVLSGRKRATTGSVWSFEAEAKRLPRLGDLSVVTDYSGNPLCVIETTRVDVMPFSEVSAEFAAVEGEGDGSLDYWRRGHTTYFTRECARHGRTFDANMLVACERFIVVFKARSERSSSLSVLSSPAPRSGQPTCLNGDR
jgi:uncharacterized protein YhfF